MKQVIIVAAFAVVTAWLPSSSKAEAVTDTIKVTSMQCGMCKSRIEKLLKASEFISGVEADVESETVVVTYDPTKANKSQIEKLISRTGYDTENIAADADAQNSLHGCCKPGAHKKESGATAKKQVKKATSN